VIRYALQRLLHLLPTLFGVLVLTFVLFDVVGGSPAAIVLGKNASAESLAEYDRQHGYDRPLLFGWRARVPGVDDGLLAWRPATTGVTASAEVALPYRLFPGQYRWTLRWPAGRDVSAAASAELRLSARGGVRTLPQALARRGGGAVLCFEVPADERLEGLSLTLDGGAVPDALRGRLRRVLAHPFGSQFLLHVGRLLRGDLGESIEYRQPVAQVLREGVGVSLSLTVPILLIGTALSLFLGLLCAAGRGGWFDRATLAATTALMSVNYVIWVVAGQYLLAYRWKLFPLWGYESWTYLALPVLIGVVSGLARDVRFYRTVMLDEVGRPHVRTALAKGLSPARVLWRHVLRNSLVPVATNVSLAIPFLFTGSILLESFFGLPGLGGVGLNAVHSSDVAMVRAVVLVGAVLYQLANLAADVAYAWFDPRVRVQ
jgi:peptide/nickel transport system permease protein